MKNLILILFLGLSLSVSGQSKDSTRCNCMPEMMIASGGTLFTAGGITWISSRYLSIPMMATGATVSAIGIGLKIRKERLKKKK